MLRHHIEVSKAFASSQQKIGDLETVVQTVPDISLA